MDVNFIRRGRNIDNFLSLSLDGTLLSPPLVWRRVGTKRHSSSERATVLLFSSRGGDSKDSRLSIRPESLHVLDDNPSFLFHNSSREDSCGRTRACIAMHLYPRSNPRNFRFGIERFVIVINYSQRRRFEPFTLGFERYLFTIDLFYHILRSVERYMVE